MIKRRDLLLAGLAGGAAATAIGAEARSTDPVSPAEAERLAATLRTPHKQPRLVVAPSFRRGQYDSHGVDCPFVYRHGDRHWMTYVGFDGVGYRTGLASSADLVEWRREGLLIDRGPPGSVTEYNVALTWILRENALRGPGRLTRVGGRYLGTYHAYPQPGYEVGPACIGLCWSDDLRRWEIRDPFLHAADGAAWEQGGLYKSCLVRHRGAYWMFYNAKTRGEPWVEQIGAATSRDLRTWKRHEANPLLRVGPRDAWDGIFAADPCVLQLGRDLWALFYYGLSTDGRARNGVAFSRDLVRWTKAPAPLLDVGPPGSPDSRYAHKPSMFWRAGRLYHYYCAVSPAEGGRVGEVETGEVRGIGLATS